MGDWHGASNWYGGKIQQILRLRKSDSPASPYEIVMEKLESTRSNRFARFLGSTGIAQMRIDKKHLQGDRERVHAVLSQNFVVCGRIFRPFASKDDSMYMMQTTTNFERASDEFFGDQHRFSFAEFLTWHNPLALNSNQVRFPSSPPPSHQLSN
jgi:RNA-dependent RNA polymerase